MKKMLLVGMLVVSAITFARDQDEQEKKFDKAFDQPVKVSPEENQEIMRTENLEMNKSKNKEFLNEISDQDRGEDSH